MNSQMWCLVFLTSFVIVFCQQEKDLVTNLPGVNFETSFKTYAGYLKANKEGNQKLFYMLTESKSDPANDPLIIWFNGGPGCSSLIGMFVEMGPFFVNQDGQTLFENVYAWNAKANILLLESPVGVGFSYDTKSTNFTETSDDQIAWQNYLAVIDFFEHVQPKYENRTFFVAGESYAGIYVPMLSKLIVEGIKDNIFPNPNFQGAAIGNGFMHVKHGWNSLVLYGAYHGKISQDNWEVVKKECKTGNETDHDKYDYTQFMTTPNKMDYFARNDSVCGRLLDKLTWYFPTNASINYDSNNYYHDCYDLNAAERRKRSLSDNSPPIKNTAELFNYDSTDNQLGYMCWASDAITNYLNRKEVQNALHIDTAWQNREKGKMNWSSCNSEIYMAFTMTHVTTNKFFAYVLQNTKVPNFRFLIYNGDADTTVCNYLGNAWLVRDVSKENNLTPGPQGPWVFARQLAGYVQSFKGKGGQKKILNVSIDLLSVRGAGHFAPINRPGPALQMITNFMYSQNKNVDYSSMKIVKPKPKITSHGILDTLKNYVNSTKTFLSKYL